jgi:hypothetical protein
MFTSTSIEDTARLEAFAHIRQKLGDVRCELLPGNGGHVIYVYAADGREIACGFGKTIAAAASWAITDATNREIKERNWNLYAAADARDAAVRLATGW